MDGERIRFSEYLAICGTALAGAVGLSYAFAGVHYDVSLAAQAAGEVDPVLQAGVTLGYVVLVGGALLSAAVAVWSGLRASRIAIQERRAGSSWGNILRGRDR